MQRKYTLSLIFILIFTLSMEGFAQTKKRTTRKSKAKVTTKKRIRRVRRVKRPRPKPRPKTEIKVNSENEIKMESRVFDKDEKAYTRDTNFGLFTRFKVKSEFSKSWNGYIRAIARGDKNDQTRNVMFFEEAYLKYEKGDFEFNLGSQMVNWSATEAFHPADIINSRNFDSNLENAEKIGEPMASVSYTGENSKITAMYMPMLTKPILPSATNRLSLSGGIPLAEPEFLDENGKIIEGEMATQYALRYEYTFDDSDLSLHYVNHWDRTTPFVFIIPNVGAVPLYLPVTQMGGTFQLVSGAWVLKLELANRVFKKIESDTYGTIEIPDSQHAAFGLEYGWSGSKGQDVAIILEGQGIFGPEEEERAAMSIFQRDVLLGVRYALNDIYAKEYFASVIYDIERSSEMLFNFIYKRRINSLWSLDTGFRIIQAPQKEAVPVGLENLNRADQVFFNLTRYF